MVKESTMKNEIELREEREIDTAKAISVRLSAQLETSLTLLHHFDHNFKTFTGRLDINVVNILMGIDLYEKKVTRQQTSLIR